MKIPYFKIEVWNCMSLISLVADGERWFYQSMQIERNAEGRDVCDWCDFLIFKAIMLRTTCMSYLVSPNRLKENCDVLWVPLLHVTWYIQQDFEWFTLKNLRFNLLLWELKSFTWGFGLTWRRMFKAYFRNVNFLVYHESINQNQGISNLISFKVRMTPK